ncbi:glycosyl hydrolase 53 family protein [Flavobacteriaceae sp. LMIT009]
MFKYAILIIVSFSISCNSDVNNNGTDSEAEEPLNLYLGADLSYVNEMLDCGGEFRENGTIKDPYQIFADAGTNIVRVRLWHNPTWTSYSNLDDVKKTIRRSKEEGMKVLLDFHYSDDWADPGDQIIPEAWKSITDLQVLGDSLYIYTFNTLNELNKIGLTPEMVQIGNEINSEILLGSHVDELNEPINWERNVFLLNKGIQAVDNFNNVFSKEVETMIHIAQPEFTFPWFDEAFRNGLIDFDWIGISYYPKWSSTSMNNLPQSIAQLKDKYSKRVMVVETAYPYSLVASDAANNILMQDALIPNYPATKEGQLNYMLDLTKKTIEGGGEGVIYWEPAWISTNCSTRWGTGSHWENATFFDAENNNEALPAFNFYNTTNYTN